MLEKLLSRFLQKSASADKQTEKYRMVSEEELQKYEFLELLYEKIFETESALHNEEDPMKIAIKVMQSACELYEADWCGILTADLQTQLFQPEIWYEVGLGPMKETLFYDIEFTEEYATWAEHLIRQEPLIIPDAEKLRETKPKEYESYKRLNARSIIGVPFGQHPLGFMIARNPKRYIDRYEPLQLACFVAMMMLEQVRRARTEELTRIKEDNDGKFHIRYNILGPHNMLINGREIYEQDLLHPNRRAWVILLYMVLHKGPFNQMTLIADNWPDEPETSARNNIRQAIYRLHNDLAAYHDVKVVDARNGSLVWSEEIRITTDAEEMETLYKRAMTMPDSEDKIAVLKKAYSLYRGRLFAQGDMEVGNWLLTYTSHYNQIFVDITTELLTLLGHRKDYRCIMDYGPPALEKEPGMQAAYYWVIVAADGIGNSVTKEKTFRQAEIELTEEEFEKLEQLLEVKGIRYERKITENTE